MDAHADINEHMFGETIAHGTILRHTHDGGLLQDDAVFQIGMCGTGYTAEAFEKARAAGTSQ